MLQEKMLQGNRLALFPAQCQESELTAGPGAGRMIDPRNPQRCNPALTAPWTHSRGSASASSVARILAVKTRRAAQACRPGGSRDGFVLSPVDIPSGPRNAVSCRNHSPGKPCL